MSGLPEDVKAAQRALSRDPSNELAEVASKLIADSPPIAAMWRTLERLREPADPPLHWVWQFLELAREASNLPPFHYKSALERRELANSIGIWATSLRKALEENGLDAQVFLNKGKLFNGFFFYEDFGDSNRARIDADGLDKLKVSLVIEKIAERALERIANEPKPAKKSANVRAVRFVRIVAERNERWYGKPLNEATAAAANAIFGTIYSPSDIRNLRSR